MASASTSSTSASIPPFVSPILSAFTESIKPPIAFLMIGTIFSSMLVPLLVAVLYFSNPKTRRQPVYMVVIFVILLALTLGVWNGVIEVRAIISPLTPQPDSEYFAFEVAYSITPWLVDLVLFLRLLAVFNPTQTHQSTLIAVLAFPIAIKALRLAMIITFAVQWHRNIYHIGSAVLAAGQTWATSFCVKVEWVAQIFDNGYASAVFMYRLRGSLGLSRSPSAGRDTIGQRIQALFWIAATNFVFPVMFNLAQIIAIFASKSFFIGAYLMMVNTYLSILGVVFATVWSSSSNLGAGSQDTLRGRGSETGGRISFKNATADQGQEDCTPPHQTLNDTEWLEAVKPVSNSDIPMSILLEGAKQQSSEDSRSI